MGSWIIRRLAVGCRRTKLRQGSNGRWFWQIRPKGCLLAYLKGKLIAADIEADVEKA